MADSRYVIDIAAEMSGSETVGELDALIDRLQVGGRKSDDFQATIKRVTSDLDAARSAAGAAAAALAEGNDQYRVLEREATRAAKAVEKAQLAGRIDLGAARQAGAAQAALDAYTGTLKSLEDESAKANAEQSKLESTLKNLNKVGAQADSRIASTNQKYEKLQAAVSRLPGPLGAVASQLVGTAKAAHGVDAAFTGAEAASLALAAASLVLVAAVVAATTAAVAGYVAFGVYAAKQADAARDAQLTREAFAALSAETAAGVGAFDAITAATGQTDAQLVALTKQLRAAGVSAADMPAALRAAATAEAALGQGGAAEFIDQIRDGSLAVDAFAREADAKFGGVVAKRLEGLAGLSARFSRLWNDLFKDVDLEPVLQALSVIVDMFSQANPLAQALKGAIEGVFTTIADHALDAAYAVEAFALGFAIEMTKAYIAAKPLIKEMGVFTLNSDTAADAGKIFADAVLVLAVALGVLALALLPIALIVGLVVVLFAAVVAAVAAVGFAIGVAVAYIVDGVTAAYDFLNEQVQAFDDMGADLMQGLIDGIAGAVTAVVDAVKNAVGAAVGAAKDVLGIHSPSKVFADIGGYTVQGFTDAVDAGASESQSSMANLVDPGEAAGTAASAPAAAQSSGVAAGGKRIDLSGATFTFNGVKDAETHGRSMLIEAFTQLLEDDANSLGGAAEVPA